MLLKAFVMEAVKPNYSKYLQIQNVPLSPEIQEIFEGEDMSAQAILARENINDLLNEGYHEVETGFFHFSNKSAYVAAFTKMPAVTTEMIDWWFWWHPAESLRYRIWYPEMHFDAKADFHGYYADENLSYAERLHKSEHIVEEDIGTGRETLVIDFCSPADFGFDITRFKEAKIATVICARVGFPKQKVWFTEMCHLVRKTEEGLEMRSRFWIGQHIRRMDKLTFLNKILNSSFVKKQLMPKNVGKYMMLHCCQEYANLTRLLPQIYPEEANQ